MAAKPPRKDIEMEKRVHFIGSGYESVKNIIVEAETNGEAIDKALEWYNSTDQTFHYMELEVAKCL